MSDGVEKLRDLVAASYEDVRALLLQLRDDDLAVRTQAGQPIWRTVAAITQAPLADARAAERIADGKSPSRSLLSRSFEMIADWRRRRAFSTATRRELLTAWENAFNVLFSCINDLSELPLDDIRMDRTQARTDALAYLRRCPTRWQLLTNELRAIVSAR